MKMDLETIAKRHDAGLRAAREYTMSSLKLQTDAGVAEYAQSASLIGQMTHYVSGFLSKYK